MDIKEFERYKNDRNILFSIISCLLAGEVSIGDIEPLFGKEIERMYKEDGYVKKGYYWYPANDHANS